MKTPRRSCDFRGDFLRLCPSDFDAGRHTPGSPGGAIRADPRKKSACPCRTRPERLRPRLDPDRPTAAPEAPRRERWRPDMQAQPPRETPYAHASETETAHNAAGKPQDERKIKPGVIPHGKRKCSTEPPRRRHAKRVGGRQNAPAGENPHQGEKKTRRKRCPRRV